jgi:hypothetical protein
MESEVSLPCSQEPSTDSYPEPDQSNPSHPILSPSVHTNLTEIVFKRVFSKIGAELSSE